MTQTIEAQVAAQIAHQEHVARVLARTGGEVMHPDHYDLREAIRLAVLRAIDDATDEMGAPKMSDAELPKLFKALDEIAERVFLKQVGL
jgi:hypothetical protein